MCGCDRAFDGSATESVAICTKFEANQLVCRQAQNNAQGPTCPSDMTLCVPSQFDVTLPPSTCTDSTTGRWSRPRKCIKKRNKGKCHKRKVAQNCRRTCNLCTPGGGTNAPRPG